MNKSELYFFPQTHADTDYGEILFDLWGKKKSNQLAQKDIEYYKNLRKDHEKALFCQKKIYINLSELLEDSPDMPVFSEGMVKDTESIIYLHDTNNQKIKNIFKDFDLNNLTEEQEIWLICKSAVKILYAQGVIKNLQPTEDHDLKEYIAPIGLYARRGIKSVRLPKKFEKISNHKSLLPFYYRYITKIREEIVIRRIEEQKNQGETKIALVFGCAHSGSFKYNLDPSKFIFIDCLGGQKVYKYKKLYPFPDERNLKLFLLNKKAKKYQQDFDQSLKEIYLSLKPKLAWIRENALIGPYESYLSKYNYLQYIIKSAENNKEHMQAWELARKSLAYYQILKSVEEANNYDEFVVLLSNNNLYPFVGFEN